MSKAQLKILLLPVFLLFFSCQKGSGFLDSIIKGSSELTAQEASAALKEALDLGIVGGVETLGAKDGFFGNALVRLALPDEAKKVERTLRSLGMGRLCDDAILSLNRAAESASREAVPVFGRAIRDMTFSDAMSILLGDDSEATDYLKSKTFAQLQERFMPITKDALNEVHATKYWSAMMTQYNRIPLMEPVKTNLPQYVTGKTLSALFKMVGQKEMEIRKNPIQRTTDLLKKAFGYADQKHAGNSP